MLSHLKAIYWDLNTESMSVLDTSFYESTLRNLIIIEETFQYFKSVVFTELY